MELTEFSLKDLDALVAHSQTIGWYDSADWSCFLNNGIVVGHKTNDKIVSSLFLANYFGQLGWVGACIVNPSFQKRGLGKDLIEYCRKIERQFHFPIGLVSTSEGKALYEGAGFRTLAYTHKYVSEVGFTLPGKELPKPYKFTALSIKDLDRISALDKIAIGADRSPLLKYRMSQTTSCLGVVDDTGELQGFIFTALDNGQRVILGPVVSPNDNVAVSLLCKASESWNGCMRIDIPNWQKDFISMVSRLGFTFERECPIMTLDGHSLPTQSKHYFGLLAQAFG